jgi:hypothetical protein
MFSNLSTAHKHKATFRKKAIIVMNTMDNHPDTEVFNAFVDSELVREEMEVDEVPNHLVLELLSSSEEEDEEDRQWGGSKPGRAPSKQWDFAGACAKVVNDCFNGVASVHSEENFERRFRMPRAAFNGIEDAVMGSDPFVQKTDVMGKQGIHLLVKLVACLHYLACGDAYDREDEILRIAQSMLASIV